MDSVSEAVDYELDWILGASATCKHYRLQTRLTIAANQMDDTSPENLTNLKQEAKTFLEENADSMRQIREILRPGRGSNMPGIGLAGKTKASAQVASSPK